jgi:hypothetical protein
VITLRREDEGGLYSACPPGGDQEKGKVVGHYLHSSLVQIVPGIVGTLYSL